MLKWWLLAGWVFVVLLWASEGFPSKFALDPARLGNQLLYALLGGLVVGLLALGFWRLMLRVHRVLEYLIIRRQNKDETQ